MIDHQNDADPLKINLFVLILIILILGFLLYVIPAKGAYLPIPRNKAWDDLVQTIGLQKPDWRYIQKFLVRNEHYPRVKELDAGVLEKLDDAIERNRRITKDLRKIRKAISADYGGGP